MLPKKISLWNHKEVLNTIFPQFLVVLKQIKIRDREHVAKQW